MQPRIRIVAMGDSTTAGTPAFQSPVEKPPRGAGDETSQYAYWLMRTHPGWEVLNRGVNGERTDQIAARFERDVIAAAPAVVILIAGVNDIYQGREVGDVTRRLRAMYDAALARKDRASSPAASFRSTPRAQTRTRRCTPSTTGFASRRQPTRAIAFVDTRAAVAAPGSPDRLASSPDDLHPSVDGYRRMAEAIAPVVVQALGR